MHTLLPSLQLLVAFLARTGLVKATISSIGRLLAAFDSELDADIVVEVSEVIKGIFFEELPLFCWSCGPDCGSFPVEFSNEKSPSDLDSSKSVFVNNDVTYPLD